MKTWAPKQKSIYYDLQAGVYPSEIVKIHKISPACFTKIKNSIASAEHPGTVKKVPKAHNAVKNFGNEAGSEEKQSSTGLPTQDGRDNVDTTISCHALSLDPPVVLQGKYVAEKQGSPPKPAPGKPSKNVDSLENKAVATG